MINGSGQRRSNNEKSAVRNSYESTRLAAMAATDSTSPPPKAAARIVEHLGAGYGVEREERQVSSDGKRRESE